MIKRLIIFSGLFCNGALLIFGTAGLLILINDGVNKNNKIMEQLLAAVFKLCGLNIAPNPNYLILMYIIPILFLFAGISLLFKRGMRPKPRRSYRRR